MSEHIFLSADGKTNIHLTDWETTEAPRACLVIVHGMTEHRHRYADFAKYMSDAGVFVTIHDLLGHGDSVINESEYGYFGEDDGNANLLSDINTQVERVKEMYPDIPIFVLGHSMGSFLTRQYICRHSRSISGAIIMGTGMQPQVALSFGKGFAKGLSFRGWHHRSNMIQLIAFGSYLKRIRRPRTTRDWLTRDDDIVDIYINDPRCMFLFTLNGFYNMFRSIELSQSPNLIKHIRKDLPMLFVSGEEDPVGNYGKAVLNAVELYRSAGIENVKCKLYKDDRHEVLNELDREEVYRDILEFVKR